MKRRALVLSSILAGFCLLLMGLVWNRLVPTTAYWSPEQAEEYSAAQLDMHSKSHQHGDAAEKEMTIARERFAKISDQLDRARGTQKFGGTIFLAAGVLLLLAGVGLHFAQNRSR
jgi:hypothetical protein